MSTDTPKITKIDPSLASWLEYELEDIETSVRNGNISVAHGIRPDLGWALDSWVQMPHEMRQGWCGADDDMTVSDAFDATMLFMDSLLHLIAVHGTDALIIEVLEAQDVWERVDASASVW